jgi:hypothetical protein
VNFDSLHRIVWIGEKQGVQSILGFERHATQDRADEHHDTNTEESALGPFRRHLFRANFDIEQMLAPALSRRRKPPVWPSRCLFEDHCLPAALLSWNSLNDAASKPDFDDRKTP